MERKHAWKWYARYRVVTVKSYHSENGIFKAKKWVEAFHRGDQRFTFVWVNAHHQNGMSERLIK